MTTDKILQIAIAILGLILIIRLCFSKILERYFLFENIKSFFTWFFVFTFITMLDRILDLMNLIFEKQLDIVTVINLFILSLPFLVALTVPLSVLFATIISFGRISVDQEITATKSTGVNPYRLTILCFIFYLFISVFMIYFNDFIMPEANHVLKNLVVKVTYKKPITAIKPGTFSNFNNLTVYAKDRSDEALYDLLIFNTENSRFPQTVQAKRGEIYLDPAIDQLKVILFDGEMFERDNAAPENFTITKFENYTFYRYNLGYGSDDTDTRFRGNRELTSLQIKELSKTGKENLEIINSEINEYDTAIARLTAETIGRDPSGEYRRFSVMKETKESQKREIERQLRIYTVEMNKKYSLGAACFIFFLVGLPVGMMAKTSALGVSFVFSSIIFLFYYIMIVMGEEMGVRGVLDPALSMWLPAIFILIFAITMITMSLKEKSFDILVVWNLIKNLRKKKKNAHT